MPRAIQASATSMTGMPTMPKMTLTLRDLRDWAMSWEPVFWGCGGGIVGVGCGDEVGGRGRARLRCFSVDVASDGGMTEWVGAGMW